MSRSRQDANIILLSVAVFVLYAVSSLLTNPAAW